MVRYHGYVYWIIGVIYLGFFVFYACTHSKSFASDLTPTGIFMCLAVAIIAAIERRYLIKYLFNNRKEEWGGYEHILRGPGIFFFLISHDLESDPDVYVIKRNNRAVTLVFVLVLLTLISIWLTQ